MHEQALPVSATLKRTRSSIRMAAIAGTWASIYIMSLALDGLADALCLLSRRASGFHGSVWGELSWLAVHPTFVALGFWQDSQPGRSMRRKPDDERSSPLVVGLVVFGCFCIVGACSLWPALIHAHPQWPRVALYDAILLVGTICLWTVDRWWRVRMWTPEAAETPCSPIDLPAHVCIARNRYMTRPSPRQALFRAPASERRLVFCLFALCPLFIGGESIWLLVLHYSGGRAYAWDNIWLIFAL